MVKKLVKNMYMYDGKLKWYVYNINRTRTDHDDGQDRKN